MTTTTPTTTWSLQAEGSRTQDVIQHCNLNVQQAPQGWTHSRWSTMSCADWLTIEHSELHLLQFKAHCDISCPGCWLWCHQRPYGVRSLSLYGLCTVFVFVRSLSLYGLWCHCFARPSSSRAHCEASLPYSRLPFSIYCISL